MTPPSTPLFAFISYSRKDKTVANWLHTKLEKYPYPQDLVSTEFRPPHPRFVRRVFIDTKDLAVTDDSFTYDIKKNLEAARYLIVLCSENSVQSHYVNKEVEYFLKTHQNDTSLILPVFIDSVDRNIPVSLLRLNLHERNCPIYNTQLHKKSEANVFCFYHIAAFLLKVNFTSLYNRYETYARRKYYRKLASVVTLVLMLLLVIFFLFTSLNRQRELTKFEKDIFPLSIVFGYTNNFLNPLIDYLKVNNPDARIYILMPYSTQDLEHTARIIRIGDRLVHELGADSISTLNLPTRMKRGTRIARLASSVANYDKVYIDFASTTSTFKQIIDYKKKEYDIDAEELIKEYTDTFIRQTNDQLKADSMYVRFFVEADAFVEAVWREGEKQ